MNLSLFNLLSEYEEAPSFPRSTRIGSALMPALVVIQSGQGLVGLEGKLGDYAVAVRYAITSAAE